MADETNVPVGVRLSTDIEYRPDRPTPYRARVRWTDPTGKRRQSLSGGKDSEEEAQEWLQAVIEAAEAGLSPSPATMKLAEYGEANMDLALRGLESKTPDPYLSGWRIRVVPALGHLGSTRRGPRRIAGHGSLTTTQRYPHPDVHKITAAGAALSAHLSVLRAPRSLPSPIVVTR